MRHFATSDPTMSGAALLIGTGLLNRNPYRPLPKAGAGSGLPVSSIPTLCPAIPVCPPLGHRSGRKDLQIPWGA